MKQNRGTLQRYIAFFCITSALYFGIHSEAISDTIKEDTVTVYSAGWTPTFRRYHNSILLLALEHSVDQFGPYNFIKYTNKMSDAREAFELQRGELFHINFLSRSSLSVSPDANSVEINYPLHKGLLGLRRLIIRNSDKEKLQDIPPPTDFLRLTAGQGFQWSDIAVYHHAGINVIEGFNINNLLAMLEAGRFDYLPLSVLEINAFYEQNIKFSQTLQIHKHIHIYYPLSVYIAITKSRTKLIKRIRYGMERVLKSGDLDRLFLQHFGPVVNELSSSEKVLFILNNPEFSEKENQTIIADFVDQYFSSSRYIFRINK